VELYFHSPNKPSWHGAQLRKAQGQFHLLPLITFDAVVLIMFPVKCAQNKKRKVDVHIKIHRRVNKQHVKNLQSKRETKECHLLVDDVCKSCDTP